MIKSKSILSFKNIISLAIFIFAGVLFYAYILEHDWRYVTLSDEQVKKYRISEKQALNLYQLMKDTHEILGENNINYWIIMHPKSWAKKNKGSTDRV